MVVFQIVIVISGTFYMAICFIIVVPNEVGNYRVVGSVSLYVCLSVTHFLARRGRMSLGRAIVTTLCPAKKGTFDLDLESKFKSCSFESCPIWLVSHRWF